MNKKDIIRMGYEARLCDKEGRNDNSIFIDQHMTRFAKLVAAEKDAIIKSNNQRIETLYAIYQQASAQRDEVMAQQKQIVDNWRLLKEAHEIIFKAAANRTHWKRTAIRYLKRNALDWYLQAKNEWQERGDSNERFY